MFTDYVMHFETLRTFEEEGNSLCQGYDQVIAIIKGNLKGVNDKMKLAEENKALLVLLKSIKSFPENLISSSRQLLQVCSVIVERVQGVNEAGVSVMKQDFINLLLFQDCLVAVKAIKTTQKPSYNAQLFSISLDSLQGAKLYYMYHFNYAEIDSSDVFLHEGKEVLQILIDCQYFHTHYGKSGVFSSSVEEQVEMIMRPDASKVSLAVSSAKLSFMKNFSKMALSTKKKTDKISTFISSKINLLIKDPMTGTIGADPGKVCQDPPQLIDISGFSLSMSQVTLYNASFNPKATDSMIGFQPDGSIRLEYIFPHSEQLESFNEILVKNRKLFG